VTGGSSSTTAVGTVRRWLLNAAVSSSGGGFGLNVTPPPPRAWLRAARIASRTKAPFVTSSAVLVRRKKVSRQLANDLIGFAVDREIHCVHRRVKLDFREEGIATDIR
jgi:hypothetical protein